MVRDMEIKFKRDTSFRKQFFVPDSFAHPAKMDAQLLIWIVERYTKEGDTILDPMAGSGTMMLACTLGRDVVLVELEEKFCKMMTANWNEVKMRPQLGSQMGNCQIIQGDARDLWFLMPCRYGSKIQDGKFSPKWHNRVDKIVSSPPYSDMSMGGRLNTKPPREGHSDQSGRSPKTPSQEGAGGYVDKIVTSPPYAESSFGGAYLQDKGKWIDTEKERNRKAEARHGKGWGKHTDKYYEDRYARLKARTEANKLSNIGNLPYGQIDKIVTSPPYEEVRPKSSQEPQKAYSPELKGLIKSSKEVDVDNIGNLKSASYLEAMLQVYSQCHNVLKPSGLMILVTKNFIRNKQVVRLDTDTIKLCEQAGFTYLERHYRKLPSQSFWRIIYHQKHPEVEQILNEDVLVFEAMKL